MNQKHKIIINRYDPEKEKAFENTFEVDSAKVKTVLDALILLKQSVANDLAFRFACKMGICGSCGAIVNGKPVLMCQTFCKDLSDPIIIEPLKNFKIVKDLVVDIEKVMNRLRDALPYTNFATNKAYEQIPQTPDQYQKFIQASQCIKCMLCHSACPLLTTNKKFMGPMPAAAGFRYNHDNRNKISKQRMNSMTSDDGMYGCNFVGECSNVCPKNVDPAKCLQKLKVAGVLHSVKGKK